MPNIRNDSNINIMNLKEVWQTVLGEIEIQISRPNFLTWLKGSELIEQNKKEGVVLVSLPNQFAREWVKNRYHKLILGSLRQIDSSIRRVDYVVVNSQSNPEFGKISKKSGATMTQFSAQQSLMELKIDPKTNLNPNYKLETFVVGSSNELACAAVNAVIKEIGRKYNPLFIYGGVGLGKTHLLQAAGNKILENYKNKTRVLYVTSEKFINDVVTAIRNKRMEDVKQKYRNIDVLIIDDIQFIGGKPATELEFFYTFNVLYENQKQIIMSSDRPPAAIPTLEERLRSRFEGGMIADIGYPDYEMRLAILKTKAQQRGWIPDEKVLELIAVKVQKNVRELEGVLNKVMFYQQYKDEGLDLKKIENIVNETVQISSKNITANDVIGAVSEFFEISLDDIVIRSRKQSVVEPRQITMYLLREILKMSYPNIGEKLGRRDHTTVIHACEKINNEVTTNPVFNQKIILIKEQIFKNS
jgi:chromosomal replication initiator protein